MRVFKFHTIVCFVAIQLCISPPGKQPLYAEPKPVFRSMRKPTTVAARTSWKTRGRYTNGTPR